MKYEITFTHCTIPVKLEICFVTIFLLYLYKPKYTELVNFKLYKSGDLRDIFRNPVPSRLHVLLS